MAIEGVQNTGYYSSVNFSGNNNNSTEKTSEKPLFVGGDKSTATNSIYEKPTFGDSVKEGLFFKLKKRIPILNSYSIGKEYLDQKQLVEEYNNLKEGKTTETKKPGFFKSFLTGVGLKLAQHIPFLGSYLIGHQKLEQDNMVRELNGEETKSTGFLKSVATGFITKLGNRIPFLKTYLQGQEIAEQNKLEDTVKDMKQTTQYA